MRLRLGKATRERVRVASGNRSSRTFDPSEDCLPCLQQEEVNCQTQYINVVKSAMQQVATQDESFDRS